MSVDALRMIFGGVVRTRPDDYRRRVRQARTRRRGAGWLFVLPLLALSLLALGCGSTTDAETGSIEIATADPVSFAAAVERTADETALFQITVDYPEGFGPGAPPGTSFVIDGTISGERMKMSIDVGEAAGLGAGLLVYDLLFTEDSVYLRIDGMADASPFTGAGEDLGSMFGDGADLGSMFGDGAEALFGGRWVRIDADAAGENDLDFTGGGPLGDGAELLDMLRRIDAPTEVGPDEARGVRTTRYEVTTDFLTLAEADPNYSDADLEQARAEFGAAGFDLPDTVSIATEVDDAGLIRDIEYDYGPFTVRLELFGFEQDLVLLIPEDAPDVTDLLENSDLFG